MCPESPSDQPTELPRAVGSVIAAGFQLLFYIPIFWAVSWLVKLAGAYALLLVGLPDDYVDSAARWLGVVATVVGVCVCWVLHVLIKRARAKHAA